MKTSFSERCYAVLKKVPRGKVVTYKSLAHAMGTKAYRVVGTTMAKNPYAPIVACHRVVKSSGDVGKFAHGTKRKMQMLKAEGVEIKDNKIDLNKYEFKF